MGSSSDLDEVDLRILELLEQNSRMKFKALSDSTGIPDATIQSRVKRLVARGVIKRFTVVIDSEAMGYPITALLLIQTDADKHEEAKAALKNIPIISEIYGVLGEYDLFVKVWAKNLEELNDTINEKIRSIDGIEDVREMVIADRVKEEINPT